MPPWQVPVMLRPTAPRSHPVLWLSVGMVAGATAVVGLAALAWQVLFAGDGEAILPAPSQRTIAAPLPSRPPRPSRFGEEHAHGPLTRPEGLPRPSRLPEAA